MKKALIFALALVLAAPLAASANGNERNLPEDSAAITEMAVASSSSSVQIVIDSVVVLDTVVSADGSDQIDVLEVEAHDSIGGSKAELVALCERIQHNPVSCDVVNGVTM